METNKNKTNEVSTYMSKGFFLRNWKKLLLPLFAIIVILIIILWTPAKNQLIDNVEKESAKALVSCGDIKIANEAEKANVPFTPNISASVSGQYAQDKDVCELVLNGKPAGKFKAINGECKFDALKIMAVGRYEIGYNLYDNNGGSCTKKTTILVGPKVEASSTTGEDEEGNRLDETP